MERADLLTGITLVSFGLVMWALVLWEKYFPEEDKRFPRKATKHYISGSKNKEKNLNLKRRCVYEPHKPYYSYTT